MRAHRGSVARSAEGWRATRIPTATYSWRAMSANSLDEPGSRVAASPSGSGHWEKCPPAQLVAGLALKP